MKKNTQEFYLYICFNFLRTKYRKISKSFLSKNCNYDHTNLIANNFFYLSTNKKHSCKAENASFTTSKNMKECAEGRHFFSGAVFILLSRAMKTIGIPIEGEVITTIRFSANQSVTRS